MPSIEAEYIRWGCTSQDMSLLATYINTCLATATHIFGVVVVVSGSYAVKRIAMFQVGCDVLDAVNNFALEVIMHVTEN